ncbi:hypothetical protein HK104_000083 [Borealophlyctis nickersoniae]|nr:hypothetical protein HK104_000083 [Borealophlyctis nickersoniae]
MAKGMSAVLLECDAAVMQIIIEYDHEMPPHNKFIIEQLDDTHLLIKDQDNINEVIQAKLEEILEANTYRAGPRDD